MAWPIIGNQPMKTYFKKRQMQILAFCALSIKMHKKLNNIHKMHKKLNNIRTAQKAKFFDVPPF